MSREIKFRAFGKNIHEYLSADGKGPTPITMRMLANGCVYDPDLWVFEQYTGLKDKDGKEIYEGDIVNIQGIKYYVDFKYGGFWFNNDNRKWKANRPFTYFLEVNDCEVIGNIHEDKDLIGGGEE